ncbi:MAG: ABC transporter ATP-binding protein [Planctomycetes bacterium]|nr:ABC transporter ATP-binding protein [Planctomycetota bacterium]NOG54039.1 ABC transporter ATP-binding protein [Planctomycetota bacterium]
MTTENTGRQSHAASAPRRDECVVRAQRLTKVFRDFWMRDQVRAVDSLDFEIHPGAVFGLVGPNGSGKSTTIKIILGLLHKTSGRLSVFGKTPTDVSVKKRIGYLPEESYLYPFLNSRETLDFYAKLFRYDRRVRSRRIDELLEMVGLDAVQFRNVGQFSKGMQRRIGLAQALINDPDFLILDEPTSGLDPIGIRQVKDLILELGRRGKTILLSSHMLADVEDVCDEMLILYGGKKRAEGNRDDLLTETDRTLIEIEALSDGESDSIVREIEAHAAGKKVLRIAPARRSLEGLFLDIVKQAQSEKAQTSGASAGGPTAAFLRAGQEAESLEGDALVQSLVSESGDDPSTPDTTAASGDSHADARRTDPSEQAGDAHDAGLIDSLVTSTEGDETAGPTTAAEAAPRKPSAPASTQDGEPDRSVIDSLLSESNDTEKDKDA